MQAAVYLSFVVLLAAAYCVTRKRLHLFEILSAFLLAVALNTAAHIFLLGNLGWIDASSSRELALIRIANTNVLIPLIAVWALEWIVVQRSWGVKAAAAVAAWILLYGATCVMSWLGVFEMNTAGWWSTGIERALLLAASAGAVYGMRYLMRKDGIPNGAAQ